MIQRVKIVFYIEVVINLISVVLYLFMGSNGVAMLGVPDPQPLVLEGFRWFAVLVLVITYIMVRSLLSRDERALRFVLEGYLLGDIVYIVVLFQFVNLLGGVWAFGTISAALITVILIAARVIYLWGTRHQALSASG